MRDSRALRILSRKRSLFLPNPHETLKKLNVPYTWQTILRLEYLL